MDYVDKMQRCHDYVDALREERKKILVFQRELPLCLELVTQAIEACKRELSGTTMTEYIPGGQSDCSEQTSSDAPILEEFIPIKRARSSSSSSSGDDDNDRDDGDREPQQRKRKDSSGGDQNKKSDWLRSVQLWNQSPDPTPKEDSSRMVVAATTTEVKKNGGAFQPFQKEKSFGKSNQTVVKVTPVVQASATSSTTETGGETGGGGGSSGRKEEKETNRKQRRCWSPELHRRFLHALQQLGGSHAATPKQIRELMKVDGLTNDEVKSHLQKYRLHTRRPSHTLHSNNNSQAPQFVVVGGIWVPPPEYAASVAETAAANGIYAPVAAPPLPSLPSITQQQQQQSQSEQLQSEGRGSHCEGGTSPSTSSSTHTTTTSPNF